VSRALLVIGSERWRAVLASAALFGLAFPPFPPLAAALVCLAPITVVVLRLADERSSWRDAAKAGFWFGAVGYGLNLTWIVVALSAHPAASVVGYVATVAMLGAFVGIAMAALWRLRLTTGWPAAILLPLAWIALEVALGVLPEMAFPWLPLALATTGAPRFAQVADASGVHGVSFLLAAVNGLLADAWCLRSRRAASARRLALATLLLAGLGAYGTWRMRSLTIRDVARVTVVQPSIARDVKWSVARRDRVVRRLADLTRQAAELSRTSLIIWPEAALPGTLAEEPAWRDTLDALVRSTRTPILYGLIEPAPGRGPAAWFNAAALAEPDERGGAQPSYHKAHLVPVVERAPLARAGALLGLPFAGQYATGGAATPFTLPFGRAGVLICFESAFADRAREQRRSGADVLVAITNDAWFAGTFGTRQHLAHLVLRAIESRAGIVRAANTGISAYVDPRGIVHDPTPERAVMTPIYRAGTTDGMPLFIRYGDWVGMLCVACALVLMRPRPRRRAA
jgi:apolipoprotein N-acyltransferase